jgi:hypothetical protein
MIGNDKLRPYLFAFLAFCVLSSKHVIIYNEELLVAISFVAFVIFVFQYFGNTIKDSLDERRQGIQMELERFSLLKRESLQELAGEHNKVPSLTRGLVSLKEFAREEAEAGARRGGNALKDMFSHQIIQKLIPLSLSTLPLQSKWQNRLASSQLGLVLVNLEKSRKDGDKRGSWDSKVVERALRLLREQNARSKQL